MKHHISKLLSLVTALLLIGCGNGGSSSEANPNRIIISDYEVGIYDPHLISPIFTKYSEPLTYSFNGTHIAIEDGQVFGLRADTKTVVKATAPSGAETTFSVFVIEDEYEAQTPQEVSEGWMNDISVAPVNGIDEDYPLGIDVSMVKQIYDNGGQYYNEDGIAQDVYQILKNHGVNYIRIRLWNDPYNYVTNEDDEVVKVPYGGGINDLATDLAIAKDARRAGLKILLDFHYSDFWADPSNQVIPKAWKDLTSPKAVEDVFIYLYKNDA